MTEERPARAQLRALCLTAPTACGKTDLALELAEHLPLEIVSVDSAMVYRGMDIGTAKPDSRTRMAVRHHLIDIVEPSEGYSAGRFLRDALSAIGDITARGRIPLLVGGTLLYLRALTKGLAELPAADSSVRHKLDREATDAGWPALHARLASVDPIAAGRIAATDRQRIQRALEVYELTGMPISQLQQTMVKPDLALTTFALIPADRELLGARIERRFDAMVDAGFVQEVEILKQRHDLSASMPSMRAVGYRQVWSYLDGQVDWAQCRDRAIVATRQLAKRQMTWLRSERSFERLPALSPRLAGKLQDRIRSEFLHWE